MPAAKTDDLPRTAGILSVAGDQTPADDGFRIREERAFFHFVGVDRAGEGIQSNDHSSSLVVTNRCATRECDFQKWRSAGFGSAALLRARPQRRGRRSASTSVCICSLWVLRDGILESGLGFGGFTPLRTVAGSARNGKTVRQFSYGAFVVRQGRLKLVLQRRTPVSKSGRDQIFPGLFDGIGQGVQIGVFAAGASASKAV